MKRSTRGIALTLVGLIGLSAVWLTWMATDAGRRYRDDPRNVRAASSAFTARGGDIVTADGVIVATDGSRGRTYPFGVRYAHLVGYDTGDSRSGIEATRYSSLHLRDDRSITTWLLGGAAAEPPHVVLTVVDEIQRAARDAIAGSTGAVVAVDLTTGAVLAYVSSPAYDPNRVVSGELDPATVPEAILDRVADRVLPPGSVFKVLVTAAALRLGLDSDTRLPDLVTYLAPGAGSPIGNAGGGACGDGDTISLADALVVSCNTAFAALAVELGGAPIAAAARDAGFNRSIEWETGLARSSLPDGAALSSDPGALAQTGIGERDVRTTPLLMALLAAAVGNDGVAMTPYVVDRVVAANGTVIRTTAPRPLDRFFSPEVAQSLLGMMEQVVARGTGTGARVDGLVVAGKTGTAEGSGGPHAWFIGIAGDPVPRLAVAVVVEGGSSGGRVAAPIAAAVIRSWDRSRA